METAAVRCYGTGGWGCDWKLQQCDVTAPVAGSLTGKCSSAIYGTGGWVSELKLQHCDVTAPVGGCLT